MYEAEFDGRGSRIRWTEAAGRGGAGSAVAGAATVYVHGLGAMSAVYHAHVAAHPALSGRRSLFVDLPGHGISDRPADFGYTLEDHADALAAALDAAGVGGARVVGHSMGGSVSVVLAHRRPDLVSGLVLTEANLDPDLSPTAGSSSIAAYTEEQFVRGGGFAEILRRFGPTWAATMRLANPLALHRSATGLVRGTDPTVRRMLMESAVDRSFIQETLSGELPGAADLVASGVRVIESPGAGHNVMFDRPDVLAAAVAGSTA
ncbi:alpha/beta fold hydrolase [Streptomyces sp. NPDC012389]|uniref:alpha/beta fold hydrolase n=1 Tax=Streptomyces sp. NPDC012389 TaxID=3364830 RepID=UPI0036EAA412